MKKCRKHKSGVFEKHLIYFDLIILFIKIYAHMNGALYYKDYFLFGQLFFFKLEKMYYQIIILLGILGLGSGSIPESLIYLLVQVQ